MNYSNTPHACALRTSPPTAFVAAFALAALGGTSHAAAQQSVWVQNNGVDGASCGTQAAPCRSITRALAVAAPGATIHVGPGRYGDLNRNGEFDSGDEGPPQPIFEDTQDALLYVAKPVTIVSTHGAEVTLIDVGPSVQQSFVGVVLSTGVNFGSRGHGFRVSGGSGIQIVSSINGSNVRIAGNIVEGYRRDGLPSGGGISVFGGSSSSVLIADNQVLGSGAGVDVVLAVQTGDFFGGPVSIVRNTLRGNVIGAYLIGNEITFSGNIVDGNLRDGVSASDFDGPSNAAAEPGISVDNNYVVNNGQHGVSVSLGYLNAIVRNEIVGNLSGGVLYNSRGVLRRFELNNVYGNGSLPSAGLSAAPPDFPTNCGVIADASAAQTSGYEVHALVATNNYWGAPTGPGPNPADDSGGGGQPCTQSPKATVDTPFATAPFAVPVPPKPAAPPG
jgi:hypothetical protein